ncbi:MAG: amidohydrolase family protein [Dongiaceae bacterium]
MQDVPTINRAIDCHVHVIGDGVAYPYIGVPTYEIRPAPLGDLVALYDRWRIGHAVLVQISVHGADNSLILDALRQGEGRFRGVAVVEQAADDAQLAMLTEAGIVGLRLNLTHGGGPGLAALDRYAAICREMEWHLQLYIDGRNLVEFAPRLSGLQVPLVFDHFGGVPASCGVAHPAFRTLLAMVQDGAWVKLTGPYRISSQLRGFRDVIPYGQALMRAAPTRCLWGTDWPHVASDHQEIDLGALLKLVPVMADSDEAIDALMFANAEKLYGFPPGTEAGN